MAYGVPCDFTPCPCQPYCSTLIAYLFLQGFGSEDDIAQVITPTVVNAKLLVVDAFNKEAPILVPRQKRPR